MCWAIDRMLRSRIESFCKDDRSNVGDGGGHAAANDDPLVVQLHNLSHQSWHKKLWLVEDYDFVYCPIMKASIS